MTPQEALDAIGRLCDEADRNRPGFAQALWPEDIRAILDQVSAPVPARDAMAGWREDWGGDEHYPAADQSHLYARVTRGGRRTRMNDSTRPVTGFHARTDAEKLAKIAEAIADLHLATGAGWTDEGREGFVRAVCAILAAHVAVDRAALIDLLRDETGWNWGNGEQDEPEPIFGCDTRVPSSDQMLAEFADRILALVQPADGVILSPDEVALARSWYTRLPIGVSPDDVALAARLEASS